MRKGFLILVLIAALTALAVISAGCAKEAGDPGAKTEPGGQVASSSTPDITPSPAPTGATAASPDHTQGSAQGSSPGSAPEPTQGSTQGSSPGSTPEPTQEHSPAPETSPAIEATPVNDPAAADYEYEIIKLGGHDWRIVGVSDNMILIVSDLVLEIRAYDGTAEIAAWENSRIRSYLNGEFIENTFSEEEKARIIETTVINDRNQWFSTSGGKNTTDRVFLLSLAEVMKYFGDSGQLEDPIFELWIGDDFNSNRVGEYDNGGSDGREAVWWWLRSPGRLDDRAAIVADDGFIYVYGGDTNSRAGIRPALWLDMGESGT